MKQSSTGKFYGETNKTINLNGITLTDTVYTHHKVDWHYHEHAYFTFILEGNVIEGNKKEVYNCTSGSLLFHNWQEPHYNIKPEGFTRGFHLEIDRKWLDHLDVSYEDLQGSINILNPDLKFLMYKIFRATKMDDASTAISVQTLLLEILSKLQSDVQTTLHKMPRWVAMIDEILRDQLADSITLEYLSKILTIHPMHLSRDFSKYFNCNLGEYLRKLKVEKALALIAYQHKSLTEIAYECGFTDQSHFNRCFKEFNGLNPSKHRKLLLPEKDQC